MHPRIRREQKRLCAFTSSAATDGWNYLQRPGTVGPPVSKVVTRHMSGLSHVTHTESVVTKLADCSSYVSLQSCHTTHVTIVTRHTHGECGHDSNCVSANTPRSYLCRYLPLSLLDGPHTQAGVSDIVECAGSNNF